MKSQNKTCSKNQDNQHSSLIKRLWYRLTIQQTTQTQGLQAHQQYQEELQKRLSSRNTDIYRIIMKQLL